MNTFRSKYFLTFFLAFFLFLFQTISFAQTETPVFKHRAQAQPSLSTYRQLDTAVSHKNPFLNRVFYGGTVGFDFSNGWLLEWSPSISYKFDHGFSLGTNMSFRYLSAVLQSKYGQSYNAVNYTGSAAVFARQKLDINWFCQAEATVALYDVPMYDGKLVRINAENKADAEHQFQPALPIGLGYTSGDQTSFTIMALYDVLYQIDTPKPSGWTLRMGFERHF